MIYYICCLGLVNMIVFPNAKINLGLNVVARREDGYHNIDSLFYPIPLNDVMELLHDVDKDDCTFTTSGIAMDCVESDNLVVKAYYLLKERYNIGGVKIHLHKCIPFGAGLGGGSSDAAFALKALNEMFELALTANDLKLLAVQLGADCPFFIDNKPAFVSGIGDVMREANVDLSQYFLAVVKPDLHVPTAAAYKGVVPTIPELTVAEITRKDIMYWSAFLTNDFEKSVFDEYPEIEELKRRLNAKGALYVAMSGSGAAVYSIHKKEPILTDFADSYFVWKGIL